MPYGEIFRIFFIDENGQIKLDGDPHNHFPLSQPSHMTIFMDDEDICRIKQSWLKDFFVVDVSPTQEMIEAAARRQKDRTGFSDWEYRHSHSKNR
jgi:hypothetical protein